MTHTKFMNFKIFVHIFSPTSSYYEAQKLTQANKCKTAKKTIYVKTVQNGFRHT